MVDFAEGVSYAPASGFDDASFAPAEDQLAGTPLRRKAADRVVFPDRTAPELLIAKWAG